MFNYMMKFVFQTFTKASETAALKTASVRNHCRYAEMVICKLFIHEASYITKFKLYSSCSSIIYKEFSSNVIFKSSAGNSFVPRCFITNFSYMTIFQHVGQHIHGMLFKNIFESLKKCIALTVMCQFSKLFYSKFFYDIKKL